MPTSSIVIDPAGASLQGFSAHDFKTDGIGGLHVIYTSAGAPRYGKCSFACLRASSWQFVTLAGQDASFNLQMGVSADGKVYLAWEDLEGINTAIKFAQCLSGYCTSAANWQVVTLDRSVTANLEPGRNLLVDAGGRVHLLAAPSGIPSYMTCSGDCSLPASWSSVALANFDCESVSLALGRPGQVAAACVRHGAVKVYECASGNCTTPGAWTMTTVSSDGLAYRSHVSLSYDASRPRLAYFDDTFRPNLWKCDANCQFASNWSGVGFPPPQRTTVIEGLHLTITASGIGYFTTAVDGAVRVMRCSAGDACWAPGNAWTLIGVVETEAQAAATVTSPVPVCPGTQMGFSQLWDRESPVLVPTDEGPFILTRTSDFWGCLPNSSSYVQSRHRVHLSYVPLP